MSSTQIFLYRPFFEFPVTMAWPPCDPFDLRFSSFGTEAPPVFFQLFPRTFLNSQRLAICDRIQSYELFLFFRLPDPLPKRKPTPYSALPRSRRVPL